MVSVQIQKKDLWFLSAIMIFLIGAGYVIAWGSENPVLHGHDASEIVGSSTSFGAWTNLDSASNPLAAGSTYRATSDGFVTVHETDFSQNVYGYTDSSSNPTTLRFTCGAAHAAIGNSIGSFTMPVRNGDYWKITGSPNSIYWIPIGDGVCEKQ